jgi:pimeloyl-ACP methyl ester carboxylesterase
MSVKLFSRILGEEGLPELVILHGLLGSADNWQTLGKRYAEHFRVHLLDARNHGRSPHSEGHSYQLMLNDLLDYLDDHRIEKVNLLGHSMGGKTVMAFSEEHPERVSKMIVADIAPKAYSAHHGPIFDALLKTNPESASSRGEVSDFLSEKLKSEPYLIPFLMKGLHREKSGGYSWRFNVSTLAEKLEGVTEEVQISINTLPVLFIRGLKSNYVSDEELERIEGYYMQMEVAEIEDAGHWLHAEQPDEFYDITLRWFL